VRLKIAFVTSNDPTSITSWSGTSSHMYTGLKSFAEVEPICPSLSKFQRLYLRKWSLLERLTGKRFLSKHSISYSRFCSRYVQRKLGDGKFDLVFAPAASAEIAFLKTSLPVIYLSDATFNLMVDYYERFSNLSRTSVKAGNLIEKRALSLAKRIIVSSHWAENSILKDYLVPSDKVTVIPFGPNITTATHRESGRSRSLKQPIRLLFVGVDWKRKGGETAYIVMKELNSRGVETYLTVCGCVPPKEFDDKRMNVIPFLDKSKRDELDTFYKLFEEASFFILPTRAECFGMVLGEAASFGLPALATRTGGVGEVVNDGVSGFLFDSPDNHLEYVEKIQSLLEDDHTYSRLCEGALNRSANVLNWKVWTERVQSLVSDLVSSKG